MVAILVILAAIAMPQFAVLLARSQEGATKGNLGVLRSALSAYYSDTNQIPQVLAQAPGEMGTALDNLMLGGKYINNIPTSNLPKNLYSTGHFKCPHCEADYNKFFPGNPTPFVASFSYPGYLNGWSGPGDLDSLLATEYPYGGIWAYDLTSGTVVLECKHKDMRGQLWTTY